MLKKHTATAVSPAGSISKLSKLEKRNIKKKMIKRDLKMNKAVYLMVLPIILYYIIFSYIPMAGIVMAFKNYKPALGIFGSPWTDYYGFGNFIDFLQNPFFGRLMRNTITISLYSLIFSFPAPIILALVLSEIRFKRIKRTVQTISYFPHFISTVVVCGLLTGFCLTDGLFNDLREMIGLNRESLLQVPKYFRTIYIGSGIWQGIGWSSIMYIAAIAGVDTQLYEAAALDGAGRFKRIWHITLPGIKQTVIILFILQMGKILSVGSEKILLMYNESTYEVADVISTYVYRKGLLDGSYSYSAAVSLFEAVISFTLVFIVNKISSKLSESSLF